MHLVIFFIFKEKMIEVTLPHSASLDIFYLVLLKEIR